MEEMEHTEEETTTGETKTKETTEERKQADEHTGSSRYGKFAR